MMAPPTIAVRVREVEALAPTLKRFTLEAADGGLLPTSSAGSHVVFSLKGPDRTWKNAYSVVSPPGAREAYQVIVRKVAESCGGSAYMHDAVTAGDTLQIAYPHNLFPLSSRARKHVLIGGGIGVTPILSHLAALKALGETRFEAHQFCTAEEAPIFERLLGEYPAVNIHVGRGACDIEGLLGRQPLGAHVYTCGPIPLMDAVGDTAQRLGWPHIAVHRESFGDHSGGAPFHVVLAQSHLEIEVGETESLLEALERSGVDAPYLCRGGACGQCQLTVTAGEPDHRDDVLTAEERASNAMIMTCVSRSKTPRLVLDL
jgi:ferredoxin-NADP reductase